MAVASRLRHLLLAVCALVHLQGLVLPGHGAELTRGPYLQTASSAGITIRWRTDVPTESVVLYGTNADNLRFIAGDLQQTTEHIVEIGGLDPNTRYFYSVGEFFDTLASGPDYYFTTHPLPGQSKPTRIWAIGDCGTFGVGGMGQIAVRDAYYLHAANRPTDVWLALGDNAYYNGTDAEYQASFFNVYPKMLRNTPLWSTIGNHETYSASPDGRFPYLDMFSFPERGEAGGIPSGTERYYSFDYANVHVISLDSETSDRSETGPMLKWLEADLAATTQEWIIAFWHSPPYSKGSHDSDNLFDNAGNMTDMRKNAVKLLETYGVDLVLSGHSHIYERSYLLHGHYGFSSSLVPNMLKDAGSGRPLDTGAYRKGADGLGAVYIVAGSSGWATFRTGVHPAMFTDALVLGSMVLNIDGNRLEAKFLRETGAIHDAFTMLKNVGPEALRICTFTRSGDEVTVRWKSIAGRRYRVEETIDLVAVPWSPASDTLTASGATSTWRGTTPVDDPKRFYRVVELKDDDQ